ncbi:MAG TPA: hypothetical protein VGB82_21775 [Alphaproteobacteria bacterium]
MKKSLTLLLASMLTVLMAVLCTAVAFLVWDAAQDLLQSQKAERLAAADRILYQRLQTIRVRRVQPEFVLTREDAPQTKLEELYKGVEADLRATSEALSATGLTNAGERVRDLDAKFAAVTAGYRTVQDEGKKPRAERKIAATQDWYRGVSGLLDSMAATSLIMSNEVRMVTPELAELIGVRQLSWNIRDHFGHECALTRLNVARGQAFTPDNLKSLNIDRGAVDLAWTTMGDVLSRPGANAAIRAAYDGTRRASVALRERLDRLYAAVEPGKSLMDESQFTAECNSSFEAVVGIGLSALEVARQTVHDDVVAARFRLGLAGCCWRLSALAEGPASSWCAASRGRCADSPVPSPS